MLASTTTSSARLQDASNTAGSYAGSFAISGAQAAGYALPDDVRQVWSHTLPGGRTRTRTRYQQYVGNASA